MYDSSDLAVTVDNGGAHTYLASPSSYNQSTSLSLGPSMTEIVETEMKVLIHLTVVLSSTAV